MLIKLIIILLFIPLISSLNYSFNHFETNLDRFAKGPSPNFKPLRVLLPTNFMEIILNKNKEEKQQNNELNNFNSNIPTDKPLIINKQNLLLPFNNNNNLFINQIIRGEDFRPFVEGERLVQQGKFSGPTNQYKEDWGQKFTQKEGQIFKQISLQNGIDQKIEKDINPSKIGSKISIDNKNIQNTQLNGQITPYLNAPEEITGSRWRSIDEYFNNKNKGNRGRGPNRYVKIDLLNE